MVVCTDGPSELAITRVRRAEDRAGTRLAVRRNQTSSSSKPTSSPPAAAFTVALQGNSIYSLTTTTGQRKGRGRPRHSRRQAVSACPIATTSSPTSRARRRGISPIRRAPSRSGTSRGTASASSRSCRSRASCGSTCEDRQAVHGHRGPEVVGLRARRRRAHRRAATWSWAAVSATRTACRTAGFWPRTDLEAQLPGEDSCLGHDRRVRRRGVARHEDRVPRDHDPRFRRRPIARRREGLLAIQRHGRIWPAPTTATCLTISPSWQRLRQSQPQPAKFQSSSHRLGHRRRLCHRCDCPRQRWVSASIGSLIRRPSRRRTPC